MRSLCSGLLSLTLATPLLGQQRQVRFEMRQDTAIEQPGWSTLRIAKWTTLLASTGAVVYGFAQNRTADNEYEEIERLCQDDPLACLTKAGSSEYADATLEARYQSVVDRDQRARFALLAGQVGLAATVVMFILDLPHNSAPDDIPYDPRPLRFSVSHREVALGLSFKTR